MAFCYIWSWTICHCIMLLFKFPTFFLCNVSHCIISAYIQGWEWIFWTTLMFHINTEIQRSSNNITINEIIITMFHIIYSVHCQMNSKLYKYQQIHYSVYCIHHWFAPETWALTEIDVKRMGIWEMKLLWRLYWPLVEQGIWRIRTNKELRELYKYLHVVADIKKKRMERTGNVVRMDQRRTVKKIFESKLEGSRRGRPRFRRLENVEKDLHETKFKRWQQKIVNREEWASIIRETKDLRGL